MRFKKMIQAREDFKNGIISEEEFRSIMEDCDAHEFDEYNNQIEDTYADEYEYEDEDYE